MARRRKGGTAAIAVVVVVWRGWNDEKCEGGRGEGRRGGSLPVRRVVLLRRRRVGVRHWLALANYLAVCLEWRVVRWCVGKLLDEMGGARARGKDQESASFLNDDLLACPRACLIKKYCRRVALGSPSHDNKEEHNCAGLICVIAIVRQALPPPLPGLPPHHHSAILNLALLLPPAPCSPSPSSSSPTTGKAKTGSISHPSRHSL